MTDVQFAICIYCNGHRVEPYPYTYKQPDAKWFRNNMGHHSGITECNLNAAPSHVNHMVVMVSGRGVAPGSRLGKRGKCVK